MTAPHGPSQQVWSTLGGLKSMLMMLMSQNQQLKIQTSCVSTCLCETEFFFFRSRPPSTQ